MKLLVSVHVSAQWKSTDGCFETCMRKGNLPRWILAAFYSFIYLFIYISVCHYVEIQCEAATVPGALHAGAFKDALTSETSKSADDQKIFLKAKGYFHSGCLLENLICPDIKENTSFSHAIQTQKWHFLQIPPLILSQYLCLYSTWICFMKNLTLTSVISLIPHTFIFFGVPDFSS